MNPELKAKWVAALRSGNYKQGHTQLRRGNCFCALGVLCDVIDPNAWNKDNIQAGRIVEWMKDGCISRVSMHSVHAVNAGLNSKKANDIAHMNDHCGKNFSTIADYVEKNF